MCPPSNFAEEPGSDNGIVDGKLHKGLPDSNESTVSMDRPLPANKFQCYCKKQFNSSRDLIIHMRNHPEEKPYVCSCCSKRFSRSHSLTMHMQTHSHIRPFRCDVCGKQFGRNDNLMVHLRSHNIERNKTNTKIDHIINHKIRYKNKIKGANGPLLSNLGSKYSNSSVSQNVNSSCPEESIFQENDLTVNNFSVVYPPVSTKETKISDVEIPVSITGVKKHAFEKPYRCQQCTKTFFTQYALTLHTQTRCGKQNEGTADIVESSKIYLTKTNKFLHHSYSRFQVPYITNLDEKQFKCKFCEQQFHTQGNFIVHARTHLEEKPFKCKHCAMEFRTNGGLIVHLRSHNTEKDFKCDYCTKQFHTKGSLIVHMRMQHPGEG